LSVPGGRAKPSYFFICLKPRARHSIASSSGNIRFRRCIQSIRSYSNGRPHTCANSRCSLAEDPDVHGHISWLAMKYPTAIYLHHGIADPVERVLSAFTCAHMAASSHWKLRRENGRSRNFVQRSTRDNVQCKIIAGRGLSPCTEGYWRRRHRLNGTLQCGRLSERLSRRPAFNEAFWLATASHSSLMLPAPGRKEAI
jgi:hypothetical protein